MNPEDLINAIHLRNWYAVAGLALTLVVQIVRKQPQLAEWLWNWWPNGYRWVPVAIAGAVVAFSVSFEGGASFVASLQAAIGGALGIGGSAMGFAAWFKESPLKWDGGKGGKAVVLMLALGFSAPALASCSPASTPEARGAQAAQLTRLGYSAAAVTVKELGDLHYELAKAVQTPEQARVAAEPLRAMLTALDAANAALAKARPYVASGKDEAAARQHLREALTQLDAVLPLLAQLGKAPPPEVFEALGYLKGFLGGGAS